MEKRIRGLKESPFVAKLLQDPFFRSLLTTSFSMGWNLVYAVFNGILGIIFRSYWFASLAAYYLVLGMMRGYVIIGNRKKRSAPSLLKICGIGMIMLAVTLSGITCMAIAEEHNPKFPMIVMIAIAAYTFYMAAMSIISAVKARKKKNVIYILLRDIALTGMIGSMMALERSMLGTFGDGDRHFLMIMESTTGAAGFILVLGMAVSLLNRSREDKK